MIHKTKIITTAAAAFGLAIGTAGIVAYRNIDGQCQALEESKTEFSATKQQTQQNIKQRESKLREREDIVEQKLENSEQLVSKAELIEQKSRREMIDAEQLEAEAIKARQIAISHQQIATNLANSATEKQSKADVREREFRNAKAKTEAELVTSRKLQKKLHAEIKATQYALVKTKKAKSDTLWYQNKARKSIEQAECDKEIAAKRSCEAANLHDKAKRVFHEIKQLECELEDKCNDLEELEKKHRNLICQLQAIQSNHRNHENQINQLKRLNSDYCVTINKQKSLIATQRQTIRKLEAELSKKKK